MANHPHVTEPRDADEQARERWGELVAGRWSLLDHFDVGGKRYVIAIRTATPVDRRADLTPREREVCALAAHGHRDKGIADALRVSPALVARALSRARAKLGLRSRVELVTSWRRHCR